MKSIHNAYPEILAFLAIFFADIMGALIAVGVLIMADTFTGVWGAWKEGYKSHGTWYLGWKHNITSRKAGRIVEKLILYPLAIIIAKVAEDHLSPDIPWIKVTAGILAIVEVKSIFENMSIILGYDLWDRIRKRLWKDKIEDK